MANMRKKRCTNPACRKEFSYAPEGDIVCPWCGEGTGRETGSGRYFRFGVSAIPTLSCRRYAVRLERMADEERLRAIKAYRNACKSAGEQPGGLMESKMAIDGLYEGRQLTINGVSAAQLRELMEVGHMHLWFKPAAQMRR